MEERTADVGATPFGVPAPSLQEYAEWLLDAGVGIVDLIDERKDCFEFPGVSLSRELFGRAWFLPMQCLRDALTSLGRMQHSASVNAGWDLTRGEALRGDNIALQCVLVCHYLTAIANACRGQLPSARAAADLNHRVPQLAAAQQRLIETIQFVTTNIDSMLAAPVPSSMGDDMAAMLRVRWVLDGLEVLVRPIRSWQRLPAVVSADDYRELLRLYRAFDEDTILGTRSYAESSKAECIRVSLAGITVALAQLTTGAVQQIDTFVADVEHSAKSRGPDGRAGQLAEIEYIVDILQDLSLAFDGVCVLCAEAFEDPNWPPPRFPDVFEATQRLWRLAEVLRDAFRDSDDESRERADGRRMFGDAFPDAWLDPADQPAQKRFRPDPDSEPDGT